MIGKFVFDAIRSKVFGSKIYFERVKKQLVRSLIGPLFVIVGTPTLVLTILANIQYMEISVYGTVIKFIGVASGEMFFLASMVVVTFLASLGLNFYYSFHNSKILKETKELEDLAEREETYGQLVERVKFYIKNSQDEKALKLGGYIINQYPDETKKNGDLVLDLIELPRGADLLENQLQTRRIEVLPIDDEDT